MVLYGLKWDMATIIPTDFIQMFEAILPSSWFEDKVMHQQVSAYLSLCATGKIITTFSNSLSCSWSTCTHKLNFKQFESISL